MKKQKRQSDRSGRVPLRSPGRPPAAHREERRQFWAAITTGQTSEDAASVAGVPPAVGTRWFREAGGMPPAGFGSSSKPPSGRYLLFAEREEIALLRAQGHGVREIARRLERTASTISRELRRNAATRGGGLEYRATTAQWHADRSARRPKPAKLAVNPALRQYVQDRLAGTVVAPDGAAVHGPAVTWKGRRHGPRQDRRWAPAWSPEQIARRLRLDYPEDQTMRISHEAIYQALFIQGRGALRRDLTACLRSGRALRIPRARTHRRGKSFITPEIMISQRPAAVADRAVPGHWEGDLIIGLGGSGIGTLVDAVHDAAPPAPDAGAGQWAACQEWAGARGPRRRSRPRRHHAHDHHLARAPTAVADLGPGRGDGSTRPSADRHRDPCLLLRPSQPLAARHEREYQRPAAPVLSKGN